MNGAVSVHLLYQGFIAGRVEALRQTARRENIYTRACILKGIYVEGGWRQQLRGHTCRRIGFFSPAPFYIQSARFALLPFDSNGAPAKTISLTTLGGCLPRGSQQRMDHALHGNAGHRIHLLLHSSSPCRRPGVVLRDLARRAGLWPVSFPACAVDTGLHPRASREPLTAERCPSHHQL